MTQTLKIIIPTAGLATRMRPQTWSKPKSLVSVAGRTVLDHLLQMFQSVGVNVPDGNHGATGKRSTEGKRNPFTLEFIIIIGPGMGETQIPAFMHEHHPKVKTHFVLQPEMLGQSDAIWLAAQISVTARH